jgi:hypothetical protein
MVNQVFVAVTAGTPADGPRGSSLRLGRGGQPVPTRSSQPPTHRRVHAAVHRTPDERVPTRMTGHCRSNRCQARASCRVGLLLVGGASPDGTLRTGVISGRTSCGCARGRCARAGSTGERDRQHERPARPALDRQHRAHVACGVGADRPDGASHSRRSSGDFVDPDGGTGEGLVSSTRRRAGPRSRATRQTIPPPAHTWPAGPTARTARLFDPDLAGRPGRAAPLTAAARAASLTPSTS